MINNDIENYKYLSERIYFKNGLPYWKNHKYPKLNHKIAGSTNDKGYRYIFLKNNNKRKKIYIHRLVWFMNYGEIPKIVDHINRNPHDNNIENLRIVTRSQNQGNRKKNKKTSSKYKGVSWYKYTKKWTAQITQKNKRINLGYFETEEEAAKAYNAAALKYFGKFANLNLVK